MTTKPLSTNFEVSTLNLETTNNSISSLDFQKLIFELKSEWSDEYIYWNATLDRFKNILRLESLKTSQGKTNLKILTRQLETLISLEFYNIEKEINELHVQAHGGFVIEGYDFMEVYWDLKGEVKNFRKQARSIQLNTLQHINRHLPLYIF